jgi:hypothetical protein
MVNRIYKEMLNSPSDKNLTKSTIYNAVAQGDFGVSPLKNGQKGVIPPELTHALICHSVMMQASGEGEASSLKMRAILSAITLGTKFKNKSSADYLWRKTRLDHPHLIMPAKAIDNKDRRVDWLTYQNINDWNTQAKLFLVAIGMGTEDQGLIRKCFVCIHFCQHVTQPIFLFECLFHFRWHQEQDGSCPQGQCLLVFNARRDPSRVLDSGREGWCCSGALCQSIVPSVG